MMPISFIRNRRTALRHSSIALTLLALAVDPVAAQLPSGPAETPELEAQSGPKQHRKRQRRPVMMGTSGGNINDFTLDPPFISCCSGTLGSLVKKGEDFFILSNNHVLAQTNEASLGDFINQPGMLDTRCDTPPKDFVGQLSGFKKIRLNRGRNKVDAAIASVLDGTVDESGEIIGIGVPGNATVAPKIGMAVKKGGRTTGVRTGFIDSISARVRVQYGQCGDDTSTDSALFVKQIVIVSSNKKSFSAGGDSGSLVVEDVDSCPRQVGLLYAGNDVVTIASKMSVVMKQVKKMKPKGPAELVGCEPSAAAASELRAQSGIPELGERQLRLAERIQERFGDAVLALEGVNAIGIGRSSSRPDEPVFKVYVDDARDARRVPEAIEGIPVEVVESGPIRARDCRRTEPVG